ncbi:MAG: exodeoxyribonuclease VII large subunit [Actinomycetota bacterium]|nr:exodeoxyribonuclease VII large subunit [Actinomycetota bacterium]
MSVKDKDRVYTVEEVNRLADGLLQDLVIWVEGEVSNLRGYSNYIFFSICDEDAVLPCVMFKEAMKKTQFELQDGMSLLVRGRLGIYIRRGQYRLNVYEAQEAGEGRLRREFMRLMRELSKEGLFDEGVKRKLPAYPDRIGLITSLEGAAVRDVVINLTRRFPGARLVIRGVRVQGDEAVSDIIAALDLFNRAFEVDVLILARGGGSLEDLRPFNTEELVRAIRRSSIPVVTGVGHEPDITLSDLAADFRASTPTGAAEAATPSSAELFSLLKSREASLLADLRRRLQHHRRDLGSLADRRAFSDPSLVTGQPIQRLADVETSLESAVRSSLWERGEKLEAVSSALSRFPREYRDLPDRLREASRQLGSAVSAWWRWREMEPALRGRQMAAAVRSILAASEGRFELSASRLQALSPLAVLSRGYAIVTREGQTRPLVDSAGVGKGEMVDVKLHRGELYCEVKSSDDDE